MAAEKRATLPQFQELIFDERSHVYRLNGIQIPSVTKVMRPLSQAYYGGIDSDILDAAAKRGRAVHNSIENFLLFGIDDVPAEHGGYYEAFKAWWDEKNPQLISAESRVYHRVLRYAGTADLACVIDDKIICVDFKTSAQIVEMLTRVQLEAYSRAYESHGFKFDEKAIVQLRQDGSYDMKPEVSGDTEAWEVFGGLLTVHNYLSKYGR